MGNPAASTPEVRARMQLVKSSNTGPELRLRRLLHSQGFRYRVNEPLPLKGLRRRSDMTFTAERVVVFVDGSYWHGCPNHFKLPKSNSDWWRAKIDRNRARDAETTKLLEAEGWRVVRVWECEQPDTGYWRVLLALASRGSERASRIVFERKPGVFSGPELCTAPSSCMDGSTQKRSQARSTPTGSRTSSSSAHLSLVRNLTTSAETRSA